MQANGIHRHRALLLGHDPMLSLTRKWLLATIGCDCSMALNLPEYRAAALATSIELIIVCQTSTPGECDDALHFAQTCLPHAQVLVLFGMDDVCAVGERVMLLDSMAGPRTFLKAVAKLLPATPLTQEPTPLYAAAPR